MESLLQAAHVVAGLLFVGPVAGVTFAVVQGRTASSRRRPLAVVTVRGEVRSA
ncbi:hypothetical protein [Nocardia sp. NPDC024068]|uniref:hypothetical protein n=1 Tax=Nocardia sp. NPDC024068 TaxID=3157197 RepID=UPI003400D291